MFIILFILIIPLCINTERETYYFLKKMFKNLKRKHFTFTFLLALFISLFLFFANMLKLTFIPGQIIKVFLYIFGFMLYSVIFINVASLINFVLKITMKKSLEKATFIITALSLLLANSLMAYGTYNSINIKIKEYSLTINDTAISNEDLSLALISDLHLGFIYDDKRVEKIVNKINKLDVDLVCISGDIFDGDITSIANKGRAKEMFRNLRTKYGVYASFGNHDAGKEYDKMVNFLEESNITLLRDEYKVIDNKLIIAGRRDSSPIGNKDQERIDLIIDNPNDLPVIMLDHRPSNINKYDNNIDLILCGHTHQGQFFPLNIVTNLMYDVDYGYYQKDNKSPKVIVTSGVNSWGPPQRIGTNSEIVKINIKFN